MSGHIIRPGARRIGVSGLSLPGANRIGGSGAFLGKAGGVPWTPLNLGSALVAWWDAADTSQLSLSGNVVASWNDKKSGISAFQSPGAAQPTWSATARNGKPGVLFSGSQYLGLNSTGLPTGSAPHTVLVAGYSAANGVSAYALFWGTVGADQMRTVINTTGNLASAAYFGNDNISATSWLNSDLCFIDTNSGGTADNIYANGGSPQAATLTALATTGTGGSIGAAGTGNPWNGAIQQIVIMNRVASPTELAQLAGWESWNDGKAGSNLPIGHPYKSSPPYVVSTTSVSPLVLPAGASAVYSVVRLSTYTGGLCVDVVDATSITSSIGFVGNLCDFASIALLPQPVTISKVYDQSGNGNHATQATAANQPSINGNASKSFLIDGLVNPGGGSSVTLKNFNIPAGVSYNENAVSIFAAISPKTSIFSDAFFGNSGTPFVSMFTLADTTTNAAGLLQGLSNGATAYSTPNVPAMNGSILGFIGNGTVGTAIVDGNTTTFTTAAQALTGGLIGALSIAGQAGSFNLFAYALYPSALSSGNQSAVQSALASAFSIPQSFTAGQVILDGDSITYGFGGTLNQSWARTLQAALPAYKTYNFGIPGANMTTLTSVVSSRVAARFNGSLSKNIVVIWAGTNDIQNGTPAATVYASLQSYTASAKAAGFKVVWATMLPRTDLSGAAQAAWAAYNASMRAATLGQSNTADVLADVQADPTMGPFAAASDHTLYCNVPGTFTIGVHPTDLGNSLLAPYFIAAVRSL